MLLEHPGEVVARGELRARLWPADTFVDFDHSLNKAINKLREALGDSAESPRFIETLAKRGYRFIGPTPGAGKDLPATSQSIDSIAVFPLEHESADPDTGFLAVGIPGSIIHSLSQVPRLRVISWRRALRDEHQRADPLAIGHYHYSYHLALLRRFDEAIYEATEALSRDPLSGILNAGLAFVLLLARRYDACIEQALTAVEVDPNMTLRYITLGTAYEQKGMYAEAVASYEKGIALGGAFAVQRAYAGHVYGVSGDRAKAGEILRELKELSSRFYVGSLNWALVYESLGENELAISALQKACDQRHTICIFIGTWPQFDRLPDDPRFQEVERRIGLRE